MPELSAEKKLQQLLISNKFEKITSNTFNVEISQLEILQPFFYEFEYYDAILRPTKKCVKLFDDFEKDQALNFSHSMEIISNNIYQKFDELYYYCRGFDFDIEPLKFEINCLHEKYINKMLKYRFYIISDKSDIEENINIIISTLKWINKIVYSLKNNYDERYKFDHCEHLLENTTYLLVTTIGQIPICNTCYDDIQNILFNTHCLIDFKSYIELKPIEKYYKLKLISP